MLRPRCRAVAGGDFRLRRHRRPVGDQACGGCHRRRSKPEGHRPGGHRHRQHRCARGDCQGRGGHERAVRELDHHRRARHRHDAGVGTPHPSGGPVDPGRQMGKIEVPRSRGRRQDARHPRMRQRRIDRRRPCAGPEDEGTRVRPLSLCGTGGRAGRGEDGPRRTSPTGRFRLASCSADRRPRAV